MPSTTSSSVSSDFASSTVITPSLPTFFIASARNLPISTSPLAEIVPTWAISSFEVTFFEWFWRSATTASTARSTPRFKSIGFIPAATALAPFLTLDFLGDGDAVLGHAGSAERLVEQDVAALGTESYSHRMRECIDTVQHS